ASPAPTSASSAPGHPGQTSEADPTNVAPSAVLTVASARWGRAPQVPSVAVAVQTSPLTRSTATPRRQYPAPTRRDRTGWRAPPPPGDGCSPEEGDAPGEGCWTKGRCSWVLMLTPPRPRPRSGRRAGPGRR